MLIKININVFIFPKLNLIVVDNALFNYKIDKINRCLTN